MKKKLLALMGAGCVGAMLFYAARTAYKARHDLVTLDVRRMEVRAVARKVEWQTWETVLLQTNVQGLVTLQVKNMPLAKVLELIAEQTGARSKVIYPLYSSSKALAALKQILRGEGRANGSWTNLQLAGGMRGFGARPPGEAATETNALVSLRLVARDLQFTTLAFDRLANTRVVPEDGATAMVTLSLDKETPARAVEALAKKANRQWTSLYTLRREGGPGGGGPGPGRGGAATMAMTGGTGARRPARADGATQISDEAVERGVEREVLNAQLLEALPAAQREALEQAQVARMEKMQEMQALTPEQRREQGMQMQAGGPGGDRMLQRLKSSTPEQRAAGRRPMAKAPSPGSPISRQ